MASYLTTLNAYGRRSGTSSANLRAADSRSSRSERAGWNLSPAAVKRSLRTSHSCSFWMLPKTSKDLFPSLQFPSFASCGGISLSDRATLRRKLVNYVHHSRTWNFFRGKGLPFVSRRHLWRNGLDAISD